jgi:hypothetical protein
MKVNTSMKNYFEINDDHLCEAFGCFERPTTDVELKVDHRQTITLHVCTKCVNKFGIKPQQTEIRVETRDSVCSGCTVDTGHPRGDDLNR